MLKRKTCRLKRWGMSGGFKKPLIVLFHKYDNSLFLGSAVGRQPSYNGEDGSVRIYLRGRPVVMYKPTDLDYDISQPGNKPDHQLALEWV